MYKLFGLALILKTENTADLTVLLLHGIIKVKVMKTEE